MKKFSETKLVVLIVGLQAGLRRAAEESRQRWTSEEQGWGNGFFQCNSGEPTKLHEKHRTAEHARPKQNDEREECKKLESRLSAIWRMQASGYATKVVIELQKINDVIHEYNSGGAHKKPKEADGKTNLPIQFSCRACGMDQIGSHVVPKRGVWGCEWLQWVPRNDRRGTQSGHEMKFVRERIELLFFRTKFSPTLSLSINFCKFFSCSCEIRVSPRSYWISGAAKVGAAIAYRLTWRNSFLLLKMLWSTVIKSQKILRDVRFHQWVICGKHLQLMVLWQMSHFRFFWKWVQILCQPTSVVSVVSNKIFNLDLWSPLWKQITPFRFFVLCKAQQKRLVHLICFFAFFKISAIPKKKKLGALVRSRSFVLYLSNSVSLSPLLDRFGCGMSFR